MSEDDAAVSESPDAPDETTTEDADGDHGVVDAGAEQAGGKGASGGAGEGAEGTEGTEETEGTEQAEEAEEAEDTTPPLSDRIAAHDDALAAEVAALESELETQRAEVDELTSKLARVRADFSNYKQRAKRKREEIRERASESLVERIVPVRNDLLRALAQDEDSDIRPGVTSTLEKLDEVLGEEGVEPINPEPGDEVDPTRHQVMLRVESDQPAGTVHEVYEPGYEMGDRVLIEAQITVSDADD